MKKILLSLFFNSALCIFNHAFPQNPLVKMWDYRYGSMGGDELNAFQQTNDGGFIIAGFADSGIGGDKTQATWGGIDYWIVKTDAAGIKQWDQDFGGTGPDLLWSIQQTNDHGYILGGRSSSGIGGNKTQASWGLNDYWIVKIDSSGNLQWEKDFGGADEDILCSIQQTSDGGYIMGGESKSGISGNKTQPVWGGAGDQDYWIVKIDSLGNLQWEKDFGGNSIESFSIIRQTRDGGYLMGGRSISGISGDKTQPTWGFDDYWIVKTDSVGNKQWDKDYGGSCVDILTDLRQTLEGNYILGGMSCSDISGDKTQNVWGFYDYWILKIGDNGMKLWDKDFGGTADEHWTGYIMQTADSGYLLSGASESPIGGNKTESNYPGSGKQTWILKTDSLGNKQWDKTLRVDSWCDDGYAVQTSDGCYAIANTNFGGIAGEKTQPAWGGAPDYWIIKFCDSTLATGNSTEPFMNAALEVFPNPVAAELRIKNDKLIIEAVRISVYNAIGDLIYSGLHGESRLNESAGQAWTVDCRSFPAGMYYLNVTSGSKTYRAKFVKQ